MSTYALERPGSGGRRGGILVAVVLLHVLLIEMFVTSTFVRTDRVVATPLLVKIVAEPRPVVTVPAPPLHAAALAARQPAALIVPLITINAVPSPQAASAHSAGKGPVTVSAPHARVAVRRSPLTFVSAPADLRAYYPASARMAHQEGQVRVKVCVSAAGKITSVTVDKSSRIDALDRAALRFAKLTVWNVARIDGRPVGVCSFLPLNFTLTQAY